jgi:hypothetical protein
MAARMQNTAMSPFCFTQGTMAKPMPKKIRFLVPLKVLVGMLT